MAQKKTRTTAPKRTTRKKRPAPKKTASPGFFAAIGLSRLITYLVLLVFLLVSVAVASYVIFFRVVVADNTSGGGAPAAWTCSVGAPSWAPAAPQISSCIPPASSDLRNG